MKNGRLHVILAAFNFSVATHCWIGGGWTWMVGMNYCIAAFVLFIGCVNHSEACKS
jgi:hypothetical protein